MLSHKMEMCLLFLGLLLADARSDNDQHPPGPSGCGREGDPGASEAATAGAVQQAVRDAVRLEVQEALRLALEQGAATRVNQAVRLQVEGVLRLQEQSTTALREVLHQVAQPASSLEQLERKTSLLEASCKIIAALYTPYSSTGPTFSDDVPDPPLVSGPSDEQTAARTRVETRMKEVVARMEQAQALPSALGDALCVAAWNGSLEEVRRLLDDGADVNYTSSDGGLSPLIAAASAAATPDDGASPGVLALLLSRGADVNAVNMYGQSALHFASGQGEIFDVCLLLGAGAAVDARDKDGYTPLHLAAYFEREAAVRALVAAGASKDLKAWDDDWNNKTPFDVAKSDRVRDLIHP